MYGRLVEPFSRHSELHSLFLLCPYFFEELGLLVQTVVAHSLQSPGSHTFFHKRTRPKRLTEDLLIQKSSFLLIPFDLSMKMFAILLCTVPVCSQALGYLP